MEGGSAVLTSSVQMVNLRTVPEYANAIPLGASPALTEERWGAVGPAQEGWPMGKPSHTWKKSKSRNPREWRRAVEVSLISSSPTSGPLLWSHSLTE